MESMKGSLCVKDSYRPIGGTKQMFETNRYFKFSDVCGFYFFWGEGGWVSGWEGYALPRAENSSPSKKIESASHQFNEN